jgi:phosphoribosylformylglycinamidine (FGAM) synthase PurS component
MIVRSRFSAENPAGGLEKGRLRVGRKTPDAMIFEAAVDLSITDNTAYTVLVALQQLGYGSLQRVERSDLFRLTLVADEPADDIARALMRAEVIFNPNKHRMSYFAGSPDGDRDGGEWEAVVADRDDETTALRHLLGERFDVRGLDRIERSTAWRLYQDDGPAPKERLEWACRVLLCNAYSQSATVRERPRRIAAGESAAVVER